MTDIAYGKGDFYDEKLSVLESVHYQLKGIHPDSDM